ncbi:hypothetical protein [Micromonospora sp. NPDC007230]|uniref:hypothetical protein n=1 Tax=Micromonospora sp. NPDC007230 TaxID=3364237 RepID=UPI0036AD3A60
MDDQPVTDPAAFTIADNWHGGFYELALELGDTDDERLGRALAALWPAAGIHGCFGSREREPQEMAKVACSVESLDVFGHLRGLVDLSSGVRTVCGVVAVREDEGLDWLDFYLPMGALGGTDQRVNGFPFGEDDGPSSLEWRRPIDDWLASVAANVYATVDFRLGLIGFEVSGGTYAKDLHGDPAPPRGIGYLIPHTSGLRYLSATR